MFDTHFHRRLSKRPNLSRHHYMLGALAVIALCAFALSQTVQTGRAASTDHAGVAVSSPASLDRTFWSDSLGRQMPFAVYLPSGYYSNPNQRYPVLYMLHGLGETYHQWINDGLFTQATAMIDRGDIRPMIIVVPDGEQGYWVDHANNGPRFGSYVSNDLVSLVDREYRTIGVRQERAIGGMSMGGHGALQLALNNPSEFGIIGAHSVALRTYAQAFDFFGDKQYFAAHDPVSMTQKDPAEATSFQIWVDIGAKDVWFAPADQFHAQLQSEGVPHQWHVFSGQHENSYWTAHIADYLRFYSGAFDAGTMLPADNS